MSYEYLNDVFGEYRKKRTRFSGIEEECLLAIKGYLSGTMSAEQFHDTMLGLSDRMKKLMTGEDGIVSFDQDVPVWLNSFLGFAFNQWQRAWQYEQFVVNQRPDLMEDPKWSEIKELVQEKDVQMREVMLKIIQNVRIPKK